MPEERRAYRLPTPLDMHLRPYVLRATSEHTARRSTHNERGTSEWLQPTR